MQTIDLRIGRQGGVDEEEQQTQCGRHRDCSRATRRRMSSSPHCSRDRIRSGCRLNYRCIPTSSIPAEPPAS